MFSLRAILSTALLAAAPAAAVLGDFTAPDSAAAGSAITVSFTTSSFPENYDDLGLTFGLATESIYNGCLSEGTTCIGTLVGWDSIEGKVTLGTDLTMQVTIPSDTSAGDYQLVAAEVYNVGDSGEVKLAYFNQNITITSS